MLEVHQGCVQILNFEDSKKAFFVGCRFFKHHFAHPEKLQVLQVLYGLGRHFSDVNPMSSNPVMPDEISARLRVSRLIVKEPWGDQTRYFMLTC